MKKIKLLIFVNLIINTCTFSQWTQTGGPNGGNMREIVKTGTALFVSAGNGGIYKSIDNGETWNPKDLGLPSNASVQDLVEHNGSLYTSIYGGGIYLSTNEAENWTPINTGVNYLTFYNIMVNGSEIYAGYANGGIYYSGDNGTTWTEKSEGVSNIQFQDFSYFKSAVYAGGSSLFKSANYGDTWEEVEVIGLGANGIRSMVATESSLFLGDDGNVFISSDGILWNKSTLNVGGTITCMGVSGDSVYLTTASGKFYYTKDEGLNWTMVQNTETSSFANNIILLDDRIIMTTSEGLYSSFDGGNLWVESNVGINALQIVSMASDGSLIFAGTERQGIFRYEEGVNWTKINSGLNALNAKSVHDIIIVENKTILATGGGVYFSTNSGNEWIRMFDPGLNKSVQTLDFDDGNLVSGVNGDGIYISIDTAKTFTLTETNGLNINTSYESIFIMGDTIAVSTHNGEIFLSDNLGQTWTDISIEGDYYFTYDLHYANEKLYAATTKGLLFSEDLGLNWAFINNEAKSIKSISLEDSKIYAATSEGVFVSSETREKWYDVSGELGNQSTNEIVLTGDKIYAGTFASSVWELPIIEANLPPIITGTSVSYSTPKETKLTINIDGIIIEDPDNEFPDDYTLAVLDGENYTPDNSTILPESGFIGVLEVPITVNDGIDDSEPFTLMIDVTETLGLESNSIQEKFSVFPNPVKDYLNILPSNTSMSYDIEIYDIKGKLIYSKENSNDGKSKIIDLKTIPSGIYSIKIISKNGIGTAKIIKE